MNTSKEAPLVSIVVPAYNHERYVGSTIDSLAAQTWSNLELIIVNDGSSDATLEVILSRRAACEPRFVRYEVFDQANAGVAAALNRGIEAARGEYVFLLASDDISEPDAISTLVPVLVNEADVAVASGDCTFIDATGAKTSRTNLGVEHTSLIRLCASYRDDDILGDRFGSYASLLVGNYIGPGALLRRRAVLEVGGYDPQFGMEDYDLWLKLAKNYRFHFVDRVLCHYRWHGRNTVIQAAEGIRYDELNLLAREAGYCFANGFGELWSAQNRVVLAHYRAHWQRLQDMGAQERERERDAAWSAQAEAEHRAQERERERDAERAFFDDRIAQLGGERVDLLTQLNKAYRRPWRPIKYFALYLSLKALAIVTKPFSRPASDRFRRSAQKRSPRRFKKQLSDSVDL